MATRWSNSGSRPPSSTSSSVSAEAREDGSSTTGGVVDIPARRASRSFQHPLRLDSGSQLRCSMSQYAKDSRLLNRFVRRIWKGIPGYLKKSETSGQIAELNNELLDRALPTMSRSWSVSLQPGHLEVQLAEMGASVKHALRCLASAQKNIFRESRCGWFLRKM